MTTPKKLTRVLDKLVQVGASYLDQSLRSYVTENREYRLYTDANANTYAVFSYFTSGNFVIEANRNVDMLLVSGGGGSTIGNVSGGSGGGEVVNIRNMTLPANEYIIEIGAGGAGAFVSTFAFPSSPPSGEQTIGFNGNDTVFKTFQSANTINVTGGGSGGHRNQNTYPTVGGSGGGAGGADTDVMQIIQNLQDPFAQGGANTSNASIVEAVANGYFGGVVTRYGNNGGDSDAYNNVYNASDPATYNGGGGGGAGETGLIGTDNKGGKGGDGISIDWVNEVFKHVYKSDHNIFWGGGGGGAATVDKEPGNGGKGGGGGAGGVRQSGVTDLQTYFNGLGGEYGWNDGFDALNLKGGAGAKNTGGGAGGCMALPSTAHGHVSTLTQGENGGSGFLLIRVLLDN